MNKKRTIATLSSMIIGINTVPMCSYEVHADDVSYIKALEEENAKLKEENNNLQRVLISQGNRAYGDMNNDGFVDGRDASLLLTYYAKTSVGYTGTLDDLIQEQNNEKEVIDTLFGNNKKE